MKIMKKGPIANNAYRSSFPVDGSGQCIANVKYSETMRALGIAPICKNPVSPSAPFTLFLGQGFQFLQQSGLWGDESTKWWIGKLAKNGIITHRNLAGVVPNDGLFRGHVCVCPALKMRWWSHPWLKHPPAYWQSSSNVLAPIARI